MPISDPANNANEDERLANVQAALLETLASDLPPEEIVARLRSDPKLAEYADWIATFEPRMIETAALLVKKWGRRDKQAGSDQILEGG